MRVAHNAAFLGTRGARAGKLSSFFLGGGVCVSREVLSDLGRQIWLLPSELLDIPYWSFCERQYCVGPSQTLYLALSSSQKSNLFHFHPVLTL
jgi:hypothetical protein